MAFDITIYKPAGDTVNVINGDPPVDQSAQVATLTQQVAALTTQLATANSVLATVSADDAALAAKIVKAKADLA